MGAVLKGMFAITFLSGTIPGSIETVPIFCQYCEQPNLFSLSRFSVHIFAPSSTPTPPKVCWTRTLAPSSWRPSLQVDEPRRFWSYGNLWWCYYVCLGSVWWNVLLFATWYRFIFASDWQDYVDNLLNVHVVLHHALPPIRQWCNLPIWCRSSSSWDGQLQHCWPTNSSLRIYNTNIDRNRRTQSPSFSFSAQHCGASSFFTQFVISTESRWRFEQEWDWTLPMVSTIRSSVPTMVPIPPSRLFTSHHSCYLAQCSIPTTPIYAIHNQLPQK